MFDIGWSELLIIGIVALIAIGPKELPNVLRTVGQYMGKIRRMASEFQGQFQEAMREAEMADIKKQVDELSEAASNVTNFDPVGNIEKEVQSAIEDKPAQTETAAAGPAAPPGEPASVVQEPVVQDTVVQDPVVQDNASVPAEAPHSEPALAEPAAAAAPQPRAGSGA